MEKSFSLDELIDIDELQSIQDSFARAVGISSVILSPEGKPLTRFTNPTGFCSLIQSTEKGKERCFRSFMEMGKIALLSEKSEIFYCFADGGHFVAPIIIDGEHNGTMFAGQFIPKKFSSGQLQNLEKIAPEIGIDPGTLLKEAEKMRVVGEDVIRNYSSLLFKVVEVIARRGAQTAELERHVQERTAELAKANKGLEQEVVERKLAEEALQKEKDRAQHYLDIAGVMFLVIGADRKVILINRKGCEILGYEEEEEITGKDWFDNFVPKRLRDEVARVFGSLMAGEIEPVEYYENPVLTKRGEERIVAWHNTILRDEQGRIYATMASGEDITERKQAEHMLQENENKYRLLADNTADCIWQMNMDFEFTYVNPSVLQMFGFTPDEWIGSSLSEYCSPEGIELASGIVKELLKKKSGPNSSTFELQLLHKNGKVIPTEIIGKLLFDEDGNLSGLQGNTRDITERKAVEEKFEKKAEELEAFNELAVGRELKMIELKKEINALLGESGKEPGYKIVGDV